MDDFTKYALDYGAVGIMAYVFFWLYLKQQKRIDKMLIEQKEEEERIRTRWAAVIQKYDEEKSNLTSERLESLVKLKNEVYNLKVLNQNQEKLLQNMIEEMKLLKTEILIQNRNKEGC